MLDRLSDPEALPVEGQSWALEEVSLLAPVPQPRAIFGIGLNYADHIARPAASGPSSRWCS